MRLDPLDEIPSGIKKKIIKRHALALQLQKLISLTSEPSAGNFPLYRQFQSSCDTQSLR